MEPHNTPDTLTPPSTTPVSVIGLLTALAVLLVAVVALSAYIWYGMQHTPATVGDSTPEANDPAVTTETAATGGYTQAEKAQILDSLQANPAGLSEAEKRDRLEQLSKTH